MAGALLGLAALAFSGGAAGQAAQQGQSAGSQAAPARSMEDLVPPPARRHPGPEHLRRQARGQADASSDPNYLKQNNGERNKVQPGNNAPMWRGVAAGMEGFSSLPKSEAPEAGNLIQAPVQYPGSRLTTAGEAWRQVRNNWIIPYGGALFLISLGALAIFYFARGPLGRVTPKPAARSSASRRSSARPTGPMRLPSRSWRSRAWSWPSASSSCCR